MPQTKYFEKIRQAQRRDAEHPGPPLPPFDFNELAPKTPIGAWLQRLIELSIPLLLALARRFFPVFKFNGFYWISRHDHVREALARFKELPVPYGLEMRELSRGISGEADFVLGIDGPAQERQNAIIRRIILDSDIPRIRDWSRRFSESLIEGGAGRLDVVGDLSLRVPTEICRRYFGLGFADPARFAEWAISISAFLFADPNGDPVKRRLGLAAAARLRRVIDAAIIRANREVGGVSQDFSSLTLVQRLVLLSREEPGLNLTHAEIRAIVLGLVVGFIPTNGLAAAKMLERIVGDRRAFAIARETGKDGDGERMRRIVLEAGRLNPALAPGQWRYAQRDVTIGGKLIPAGSTVMVSTMSAMRDRRVYKAPSRFAPDAGNDASLCFGHATHRCLGEHLAVEIITEIFLPLFAQENLRRVRGRMGRMQRVGYFPQRLDLEYDSPAASQTMALAAFPLNDETRVEVERQLGLLGNPASPEVRKVIDATGIVHFASATVVNAAEPGKAERLTLLLELNVDGTRDPAVEKLLQSEGGWLERLIRAAVPGSRRTVADLIRKHWIDLHFWPWGSTGLNFFGTGDFPVRSIAKQQRLRARASELLAQELASNPDQNALRTVAGVRRALRSDPEDAELDALLVQPLRKELALSLWRKPERYWAPVKQVLANGLGLRGGIVIGLMILGYMIAAHFALSPATLSEAGFSRGLESIGEWFAAPSLRDLVRLLAYAGFLFVIAIVATLMSLAALGYGAYALLRRAEDREVPEDAAASHAEIARIAAIEDAPGYQQNHITAVTQIKPGPVRRFAMAFALWGIRQSLYWFRPGHVVTMGTIHYAKWFRLPGSGKLVFQSNYDGSWESYLEDFITRAHPGQTAAWSSGIGFPRSKGLIGGGAHDGDRFKRWVRRQQVPTQFWYSRFPELTTDHIRNAALLHDGLARAHTDTAARSWIDLVGSAQRQPYELESSEIQSLVFRGLKHARFTACLPLRLPQSRDQRSAWLAALTQGGEGRLALTFGKFPEPDRALYLALSPLGIGRIGTEGDALAGPVPLLDAFPGAFAMGMAGRSRTFGDPGRNDDRRWTDGENETGGNVEAVLLIYAPDPELLDAEIVRQQDLLARYEGKLVHAPIRTVSLGHDRQILHANDGFATYEHFGFRDGITTPVIRGTEKFAPHHSPRDIVEPGEFILGYRNNQGYFAPPIAVPATSDIGSVLPAEADRTPYGHADFQGGDDQFAPRDFGRNGTYLAIRQLSQDVKEFERFTTAQAEALNARIDPAKLREIVGDEVTGDWVAAKLMGRWKDGRPLVGNPRARGLPGEYPDNDFAYGRDDPRGHGCPLGAHIRRANPRDSRVPDDPLEQKITDRHHLIRRGRTYFYDTDSGTYPVSQPPPDAEKGLLFAALCADLERQFEMVHQTWLSSTAFHGLDNEGDPISGRCPASGGGRDFTIPTAAGPLKLSGIPEFTTLRGGGYFFMPSRSAIEYLINLSSLEPAEQLLIPV